MNETTQVMEIALVEPGTECLVLPFPALSFAPGLIATGAVPFVSCKRKNTLHEQHSLDLIWVGISSRFLVILLLVKIANGMGSLCSSKGNNRNKWLFFHLFCFEILVQKSIHLNTGVSNSFSLGATSSSWFPSKG